MSSPIFSIIWISSFSVWNFTVRKTYALIIQDSGLSHISTLAETAIYAQGYGYSLINQFLKLYSGTILYLILMLVSFLFIFKEVRNHNNKFDNLFSQFTLYHNSILPV